MLVTHSITAPQTTSNSANKAQEEFSYNNNEIQQLIENPPSLINNQQIRTAVTKTATTKQEQDIANSLLDAVDAHTIQLEAISNWSDGGLSAFKGALEMMSQNMLANKPTNNSYGSYYEDLFQLVLMDVLANAKEYGFADNEKFMQFLAWGLEYIGTGQHNSWVENLPVPNPNSTSKPVASADNKGNKLNSLVHIANYLWKEILGKINNSQIPANSLAGRLMKEISLGNNANTSGISATLPANIYNNLYTAKQNNTLFNNEQGYYNSSQGGWITNKNNHMSPMMRLVFLSNTLQSNPELSKNQLDTILFGTLQSVNTLSESINKKNVYQFIIDFDNDPITKAPIVQDNKGWQNSSLNHDSSTRPSSAIISLDFAGELDKSWLENMSKNYPSRILGDEDIKEINRLGDSVKMILQTLKYWFQIIRDERVAIARNI